MNSSFASTLPENSIQSLKLTTHETFVDRRSGTTKSGTGERRQFGNSHGELTPAGRELALAIDQYKVDRRRRYITPDEMLQIFSSLGYSR